MADKEIIIKNAHCKFFEGQTGLCKAKELTKCNPIKCKSYTIDELSTILELQEKLKRKERECEEYRKVNDEKNELLALCGITAGGERKRITHVIKELRGELQAKEKECEELHGRTASIIYSLTGGRLSYSTYTLEGCEDAYRDQLRIDVERATKELEKENDILKSENFTFKEFIKTQEDEMDKLKQALDEIEKYCKKQNLKYDAKLSI